MTVDHVRRAGRPFHELQRRQAEYGRSPTTSASPPVVTNRTASEATNAIFTIISLPLIDAGRQVGQFYSSEVFDLKPTRCRPRPHCSSAASALTHRGKPGAPLAPCGR